MVSGLHLILALALVGGSSAVIYLGSPDPARIPQEVGVERYARPPLDHHVMLTEDDRNRSAILNEILNDPPPYGIKLVINTTEAEQDVLRDILHEKYKRAYGTIGGPYVGYYKGDYYRFVLNIVDYAKPAGDN